MSNSIIVSVCCMTYNHKDHINQCLDGFVMQRTNFDFEILVHDDASTDGTTEIVKEYENKYPQLFRNVYQTENQYKIQNTLVNILFKMAKGKYIAICEGDDYWTDPYKLQKQMDILESNEKIVLCHHAFDILYLDNRLQKNRNEYNMKRSIRGFNDILENSFPKTLTVLFRSKSLFKHNLKNIPIGIVTGDVLLWHLILLDGDAYFINESMGVYRSHEGGITNNFGFPQNTLSKILILEYILKKSLYADKSLIREHLAKKYYVLFDYIKNSKRYIYLISSVRFKLMSKYTYFPKNNIIKNQIKITWYIKAFFNW